MSKVPSPLGFTITASLRSRFDELPIPRSSAIRQAILNAVDNPVLLARALEHRMGQQTDGEPTFSTSFWAGPEIDEHCDMLSKLTELPKRQVVKLAMEAYINKL